MSFKSVLDEKRLGNRKVCRRLGSVDISGIRFPCHLMNISPTGAMFELLGISSNNEALTTIEKNDTLVFTVEMHLDELVEFSGIVARKTGAFIGIEFGEVSAAHSEKLILAAS